MSISNQEQERLATGKALLCQLMLGYNLTRKYDNRITVIITNMNGINLKE